MSIYEDYETKHEDYKVTRQPAAAECMLGLMHARLQKPISQWHVLDAGCGTGNYSDKLLQWGLGKVTLYDASAGMLAMAKQNLHQYITDGRVCDVKQGLMPKLPFPSDTFDVVMFNQTLHHVENLGKPDGEYRTIAQTVEEAQRVLKPGGMLMMSTTSGLQIAKSYWYYYSETMKEFAQSIMSFSPDRFEEILQEKGFTNIERVIPSSALLMRPDTYKDKDGPFNQNWRNGDSAFAKLSTPELLREYEDGLKKLISEVSWNDFMKTDEATRKAYGQLTIVYASKAADSLSQG